MLERQLIAAVGKTLTPLDFQNYMTYHNRRLFKPQYAPRPFSYAIRLPDHSPEGTIEICSQPDDGSVSSPINTLVRHSIAERPMTFAINAATEISFFGDRFVHSYISHQFSDGAGRKVFLDARTRQFSSFILVLGRIASATEFEPKHAIILQNKGFCYLLLRCKD